MTILVINAGSSSMKFTLFQSELLELILCGRIERIGSKGTTFHCKMKNGPSMLKPL